MAKPTLSELLANAPRNWGKWGDDDETGAVNYLTPDQVLRGIQAVEHGRMFSLGVPLGRDGGDPGLPSRIDPQHYMDRDKGAFASGKLDRDYHESAEDTLHVPLHGTTHVDAMGHVWYEDRLYNGYDADTTMGGLDRCSVVPIAEHGVAGRGVLLDVARHRGVDHLAAGEHVPLEELEACADEQGVDIEERDALIVRTGWLERFYDGETEPFEELDEPGITYSEELAEWFHDMEIPVLGTDTIANEQSHPDSGVFLPLHPSLIRDQGVLFAEILLLDELAADCADDGKYDFLFTCSPLKVVRATGSPVNPLVIK